jgi:hypothetical protein
MSVIQAYCPLYGYFNNIGTDERRALMYITQYCDDPNNVKQDQLMVTPGEYPDSIFTDYKRRLRIIDKLLYLDDTFTIALDAGDSFVGSIPQGTTVFWEINKNLLNYVNAIFCLHEIINGSMQNRGGLVV